MKLQITNFTNIEELEIEGSAITVQGQNMSGKTNILAAVERCLFGTMQGRKNGITPIMRDTEHCKITLTLGDNTYERTETQPTPYLDSIWRAVMYCNLLDQEYIYIKKVCADVLLKQEVKELFGEYWTGSVESSITNVKKGYTVKNAIFLKTKNRIDFLNEQIDKLEQYTPEVLETMQLKIEEYKLQLAKYSTGDVSIDTLEQQITDGNEQVKRAEKMLTEFKLALNRQVMETNTALEQGKTLSQGKCPVCNADYKDETKLQQVREEYQTKVRGIESLQKQIAEQEGFIKTVNESILELTNQRNELYANSTEAIGSKSSLERDANQQYQINIAYAEKLNQKMEFENELQKNIEQLIELEKDPLFIINEHISPKGKVNQILQEKLNTILPGYTINILEDSPYGDLKSTFKVYDKDGIEYNQMSRSQKFFTNIALSLKLMSVAEFKLPLLIDDGEMFSKSHQMKMTIMFNQNPVEYIITKVASTKLIWKESLAI